MIGFYIGGFMWMIAVLCGMMGGADSFAFFAYVGLVPIGLNVVWSVVMK